VCLDLSERHSLDLYDPAILARPWPGVRGMILGSLTDPTTRLFHALRG